MFDSKTYTREWIETLSKENRNADKILIEKVIQALTLLSALNSSGLQFIFKGGTALMLMLNKPSRLSIDIDIIIQDKNIEIETIFNQIIEKGIFIKYSKQERYVISDIEKAHYKFFYKPQIQTHSPEEYILLDILFEKNPYNQLTQTPIQSLFILPTGKPQFVSTPVFEDILGDKLTAFAPNTTGIPYHKGKNSMSMEIIKQLYDIGNLFDAITNTVEVRKTFLTIAQTELNYRNKDNLTPVDVLDDIIQTAFCISTRGQSGNCPFVEIQQGINRIKSYIFSEKYLIENVIVSAAKASYVASLIKSGNNQIERFISKDSIKDITMTDPKWNKLNKLKSGLPVAFWYWYQAINLL